MIRNFAVTVATGLASLLTEGCVSSSAKSSQTAAASAGASVGKTYRAKCRNRVQDLGAVLSPIVSKMVAQKIPYAQTPAEEWRDCSGNFLRVSSYLAAACPEQRAHLVAPAGIRDYRRGRNNVAPNGGKVAARTTRALAKWYYKRGHFIPVFYDGAQNLTDIPRSLKAVRNRIRPGAVLWFSRGAPKSAGGIDALFKRNSAGTHINHMGIVTQVERDRAGNVIRYRMYHGRSSGKKAAVTTHHYWVWPRAFTKGGKAYPSFGYWNQRLVGFATVVPTGGA